MPAKAVEAIAEAAVVDRTVADASGFVPVPVMLPWGQAQTFIDSWNDRCHPFTWTKDAGTILAKANDHPRLKTAALRDTS